MKHINAVTKFETLHFDPSGTKVDRKGIDIPAILGFDLTDTEIAGICGAPTNSSIELSHKKTWPPRGERVPPGVYFEISCPYVASPNIVGIFAEGEPSSL